MKKKEKKQEMEEVKNYLITVRKYKFLRIKCIYCTTQYAFFTSFEVKHCKEIDL